MIVQNTIKKNLRKKELDALFSKARESLVEGKYRNYKNKFRLSAILLSKEKKCFTVNSQNKQ